MAYSTHCSTHQVQQRYEDAVVVDQVPSEVDPRSFAVWAVFDGHNGDTVSRYLAENVVAELERCLPATLPPCEDLQHSPSAQQYLHADCVRKAVLAAFLTFAVHVRDVVQHGGSDVRSRGFYSGSTATVAVQIGPLLTVANVGNTKCVLDVGHTAFECTSDHKLGNNEDEEERLDASEYLDQRHVKASNSADACCPCRQQAHDNSFRMPQQSTFCHSAGGTSCSGCSNCGHLVF